MEDKNFTIIEDIFDNDNVKSDINAMRNGIGNVSMNNYINEGSKKIDHSYIRTVDNNSIRLPYPSGNIPSLNYDEDMIKNKLNRQVNPRSIANEYNSIYNSNRMLQPPPSLPSQVQQKQSHQANTIQSIPPSHISQSPHRISCRDIFDHIEHCPVCTKYYKHSNRSYIMIIIFLVLIILLLIRQQK